MDELPVGKLTARVAASVTEWATTYPYLQSARIPPLAGLFAAAAPSAAPDALATLARVSLWVFAVDDLFDSQTLQVPQLERFTAACTAMLADRHKYPLRASSPTDPSTVPVLTPPAHALLDLQVNVRADTAQYPLFTPLADLWNDGIATMLNSMLDEARWARAYQLGGPAALPGLPQYLRSGCLSIGSRPHLRTVLVTLGDASALHHLSFLFRLEKEVSLVCRLANDLRSQAREAGEGTVNAVLILEQQALARGLPPPAALEAAQQAVQRRLDRHLARCAQMSRHPVTTTGQPEAVFARTAVLAAALYRKTDFLRPPTECQPARGWRCAAEP
ncbi:terpene synthase family protein [Streptomyces vinaceus]|uniref:terpene synthase family protein n=1 Tax=Streptomyces vinaceus TaxID=1960 RepID=UPI0036B833A1